MSSYAPQAVAETADGAGISRRRATQMLLSAAAAGFALPGLSADHPAWQHLAHTMFADSADARLASADWKPLILTAQQEESLRFLAEVMVPGSTRASVSRFIDLLLSVDTEAARNKFLGSLQAINEESSAKFGKPFSRLAAADEHSFLAAISAEPLSGDNASSMRNHFEKLKEWIVPAYYSSEIGMRELGWTPDRVFTTLPSCTHDEGHS